MDVLCIRLMVCDFIVRPIDRKIFELNYSRLETLKITSGGDALNADVNMGKLGLKVGLAGKIGNDMLGGYLISETGK